MIELRDRAFILNGKPFFLYSGEIHYFRIPPKAWSDRIKKAKDAGLNTVASYLPWSWHAPRAGISDFSGKTHPARNVLRFIDLVQKQGLRFFARVGPISNAELLGEGIPLWLWKKEPAIRLHTADGKPFHHPGLVSYGARAFRKAVGAWYDQVLPLVAERQIDRGGPVVLTQLCNEIGMLNWVIKFPDYHPDTTTAYRLYLKNQYGSIAKLNAVYRSRYKNFEVISQPAVDGASSYTRRCWDWASFYRDYYASYYAWLAGEARRHGIRVPLTANIPMFWDYNMSGRANQGLTTVSLFRDFSEKVPNVIFGGAYQMRRLDLENFHDVVLMNEAVRMITGPHAPAVCAELQIGGMNDRPRIYSSDVSLNLHLSAGHDLNGQNGYLFCSGENEPAMGFRGRYHEWQAPVDRNGKTRPHYRAIQDFGRFVSNAGERLAGSKKVYDPLTLGFYTPYYATEYLRGGWVDALTAQRDKLFFDGMARLLSLGGIQYNLLDIERAEAIDPRTAPHLWVFTLSWMDGKTQEKLLAYVRAGGRILLYPDIPAKNLAGAPANVLSRGLGIEAGGEDPGNLVSLEGKETLVEPPIRLLRTGTVPFGDSPRRRLTVVARTPDGKLCGVRVGVGKGEAAVLGFGMTHIFDYQVERALQIASWWRIRPKVKVSSWDVQAVLRQNGEDAFLFVYNFNDEPREAVIELSLPGLERHRVPQKGILRLKNRSSVVVPLKLGSLKKRDLSPHTQ